MTDLRSRVFVTGMGAVTAAGLGVESLWSAARSGRSGIGVAKFEREGPNRVKLAAQVPGFEPEQHIEAARLPYCDRFTQLAITAANEALTQAGLPREHKLGPRTAVILGTGVGGGVAIDGRPITGAQAIAGEWGHNPLPQPRDDERPGVRCYCGRTGCIETWLSGPALQRQFAERSGRTLRATEIAKAAVAGDLEAADQMELYCDRLARALAVVINILDPDAIVLGGGLSRMVQLYGRVPELWKREVFSESDSIVTLLLPPKYGDSSGVRGAAWLWPEA